MAFLPDDGVPLVAKLVLGTLAFTWILWTVRSINARAVAMMFTFPALNGVVLLTVTDKVVSEMIVGIFPLMAFNGCLAAIFVALHRALGGRQALVIALCLLLWGMLAALLEWQALWPYRWPLAGAAALLIVACSAFAFRRLRRAGAAWPAQPARAESVPAFLRDRAPRILLFFVSLLIVSVTAYAFADAHSLIGRLSALPLVPLFVLHWAVNARRGALDELRVAALIGPLAAMGFLMLFAASLSLIRSDGGALHPWYWPLGLAMLLAEWELARRAIVGLSRLTYAD
jgi:hypothetical protein